SGAKSTYGRDSFADTKKRELSDLQAFLSSANLAANLTSGQNDDLLTKLKSLLSPPKYVLSPANEAQLVTSWEGFTQAFGLLSHNNFNLDHAVYSFFNNGGSRCYVVRINRYSAAESLDEALKCLGRIDEISILAAPGIGSDQDYKSVHDKLIAHCTLRKDRVA